MATNETLIPIPGRLHSVASEGHVAGADEIYDDTLGMLQSEVNASKADLVNGKVPSEQLPSYVDDVVNGYYYSGNFYKEAAHTTVITGEEDKIYVDIPTDKAYRWSGSAYILISNPYSVDEEDLTVVNNNIKFKDRPNTDGMGKVILRKNMVSEVNTLTKSMMQATNTIYVIQYDFTLGEDITVPTNCVLEFDGGSISGAYTLKLNNTLIEGLNCISYDTTLAGICKNTDIFVEWFIGTDLQKIQAAMDYANVAVIPDETTATTAFKIIYKRVVFGNNQQYVINAPIDLPNYADIEGNNALIKITTNNNIMQALHSEAYVANIRNLTFMGNDVCALYLNVDNLDGSFTTLYNLKFETNTYTSGKFAVYLYNSSSQCVIERCTVRNSSNFLKVRCDSLIIRDCWINKWATNITQDTPSIELSEGCRYTRIENCQLVPSVDADYDYRWIDLKGGQISVANCIFGGEGSGIPVIWDYVNGGDISICDSQVACGAEKNKAGIVVLMNDVVPANIRMKNVKWSYSRVINPYGYVKDGITTYDNTKIQQAFDALMDKIIADKLTPNIDAPQSGWQYVYGLNPFFVSQKNRFIINNANIANTYNIATKIRNNTNGDNVYINYDIDINLFGSDNIGYKYSAVYKYNVTIYQSYDLSIAKVTLVGKYLAEQNAGSVDTYLTVNFDGYELSFTSTDQNVTIQDIEYVIHDNSRCIPNNYKPVYFFPQKCTETIR